MHIPCQFFKKLTVIKKNDVFLSATIELAQKMQNSFSIFVVCKERYCQTCHLYGKNKRGITSAVTMFVVIIKGE